MAVQVKRVGVGLPRLQRRLLEINAAPGQLLDDLGALAGVCPAGAQFVWPGAERPHFFGGVVGQSRHGGAIMPLSGRRSNSQNWTGFPLTRDGDVSCPQAVWAIAGVPAVARWVFGRETGDE